MIMDETGPLIWSGIDLCDEPTFKDEIGPLFSGSIGEQTAVVRADKNFQPGGERCKSNVR